MSGTFLCLHCGSTNVTVTDDSFDCHDCGFAHRGEGLVYHCAPCPDEPRTGEPVRVLFKHEDTREDETYGPVTLLIDGRPHTPTDLAGRWVPWQTAQALAEEHGVPLEMS